MSGPAQEIVEKRNALVRAERDLGPRAPQSIDRREELATAYDDAGLPQQAIPLREQVLRDIGQVGPTESTRAHAVRYYLAISCFMSIRIADAHVLYERVAREAAEIFGNPLNGWTMAARHGIARCLLEERRYGEAIAACEAMLPDWAAKFPPEDRIFLGTRLTLARAHDAAGNTGEALAQYWRLLTDCGQLLGHEDSLTQRLTGNLTPKPRPWHTTKNLSPEQLWLLSLSAIHMFRAHGSAMDMLAPDDYLGRYAHWQSLERDWGIKDRDDLLGTLEWLGTSGHRVSMADKLGHPPFSWDFARYAYVVRSGYGAEYIDEAEAWKRLEIITPQISGAYGSWREFAEDYLAARALWFGIDDEAREYPASHQATVNAVNSLLDPGNPRSPWNAIPWTG